MKRAYAAALLCVVFHITTLGAQVLQGTVVDSASHRPVPGSIVLALDASGTSVARTLTNQRGQYRLMLPDSREPEPGAPVGELN